MIAATLTYVRIVTTPTAVQYAARGYLPRYGDACEALWLAMATVTAWGAACPELLARPYPRDRR